MAIENENGNPDIWVRRHWSDWRQGKVKLSSIQNLHWDEISGGINKHSPQAFIHGYIFCTDIIEGEIAHSCRHGQAPHNIKVCITKIDNPEKFKDLLKIVGPKPKQ